LCHCVPSDANPRDRFGLAAREPVAIDDASPIATSFPNFLTLMRGLGAQISDEG
jgi:3-phosphoshikimate 1-carboxyvinyltransferase